MFSVFVLCSILLLGGLQPIGADVVPQTFTCSDGNTVKNKECCQLFPVLADLRALFRDDLCSPGGHGLLHLAFHDAIQFSKSDPKVGGGADGSILTFSDIEGAFPENIGVVQRTAVLLHPLRSAHNISDGDLLHFAAAVAISSCFGAPRMRFLLGRPPAKAPARNGHMIPKATDSVKSVLQRFEAAGFSASAVVALLAAHSTARAYETDPSIVGAPLDSTPRVFDTQIFIETLLKGTMLAGTEGSDREAESALQGELRLRSDEQLARDPATSCFWQALAADQTLMENQFQSAMLQLQLLGQDTTTMIECSEVVPIPPPPPSRPHFPAGFSKFDIDQACATETFPSIPTLAGPRETVVIQQKCTGPNCWAPGITTTTTTSSSITTPPVTSSTSKPTTTTGVPHSYDDSWVLLKDEL